MKYQANPVIVDAEPIIIIGTTDGTGAMAVRLQNGAFVVLTKEVTAQYVPVVGDYVVIQEDGYTYVNPKDVFERKYSKADNSESPLCDFHDVLYGSGEQQQIKHEVPSPEIKCCDICGDKHEPPCLGES